MMVAMELEKDEDGIKKKKDKKTTDVSLAPSLDFLTRKDWNARDQLRSLNLLTNPVRQVRLTHTKSRSCKDAASCRKWVRDIQWYHMYHYSMDDIAYNFVVDPFGRIYECRGWHLQAQRAKKYEHLRETCLDIAFIGRYHENSPPLASVRAAEEFINYGVEEGLIEANYNLLALESLEKLKKTDKELQVMQQPDQTQPD